jgi:hypothetical protein
MPGISPAKILFHPSRNWASESSTPSDERSAAKYVADLAGLVAMIDFVAHEARHKLRGLAAGVTGPA